jgi:hypothetical protein
MTILPLPPDTKAWWLNRRIHAYMAMMGLYLLVLSAVKASPEQLTAASPLLIALAWIFGAILILYATAATVEDVVKLKEFRQ